MKKMFFRTILGSLCVMLCSFVSVYAGDIGKSGRATTAVPEIVILNSSSESEYPDPISHRQVMPDYTTTNAYTPYINSVWQYRGDPNRYTIILDDYTDRSNVDIILTHYGSAVRDNSGDEWRVPDMNTQYKFTVVDKRQYGSGIDWGEWGAVQTELWNAGYSYSDVDPSPYQCFYFYAIDKEPHED